MATLRGGGLDAICGAVVVVFGVIAARTDVELDVVVVMTDGVTLAPH